MFNSNHHQNSSNSARDEAGNCRSSAGSTRLLPAIPLFSPSSMHSISKQQRWTAWSWHCLYEIPPQLLLPPPFAVGSGVRCSFLLPLNFEIVSGSGICAVNTSMYILSLGILLADGQTKRQRIRRGGTGIIICLPGHPPQFLISFFFAEGRSRVLVCWLAWLLFDDDDVEGMKRRDKWSKNFHFHN